MNPIILTFNIRQSVLRNFGLTLFNHAKKHFNMHLLPIVTIPTDGIEQRALKISKQLPQLLEKLKIDSAHVASYSSSGIDMRFAISQLGMSKHVNTLITISSPHQGSKLALLSDRKVFKDQTIQPISRLTGVGLKAFHQFVPQNMKYFNQCMKNAQNVQYFSLGSQKIPSLCSNTLSQTGKYLSIKTQPNYQYHNDGVFGHDQILWGNHITNFQADHGEVIGMYGLKECPALRTVKEIASDWNIRNINENKKIDKNNKAEAGTN